jgi:hypothetical protein
LPGSERHRNGQCQPSGQLRDPALFVLDERSSYRPARHADREVGSQTPHHVVPAGVAQLEGETSQVLLLVLQQTPDQRLVYRNLGVRPSHRGQSRNGRFLTR